MINNYNYYIHYNIYNNKYNIILQHLFENAYLG
jgi:hypothetical protein